MLHHSRTRNNVLEEKKVALKCKAKSGDWISPAKDRDRRPISPLIDLNLCAHNRQRKILGGWTKARRPH